MTRDGVKEDGAPWEDDAPWGDDAGLAEDADDSPEVETGAPHPLQGRSGSLSWGFAILAVAAVIVFRATDGPSPRADLDVMENPSASIIRYWSTDLDRVWAWDGFADWERLKPRAEGLTEDVSALRERELDASAVIGLLVVVAAECGGRGWLADLFEWSPELLRLEPALRRAWPSVMGEALPADPRDLESLRARVPWIKELEGGFGGDLLEMRLARAIGDSATAERAEARIRARSARSQRAQGAFDHLVVVLGILAVVAVVIAGVVLARRDAAAPWTRWRARDGYAAVIFGFVFEYPLVMLSFTLVSLNVPRWFWDLWPVFMGIPALAVIYLVLLRPGSLSWRRGLDLGWPKAWPAVLFGGLALAGADFGASRSIVSLGQDSASGAWREGFMEALVFGPPLRSGLYLATAILWYPIFEEIFYRGILFRTLRLQCSTGPAALLSGALFAGVHGYGAAGTAGVLVLGAGAAVVYECTRTLWAPILGHALVNAALCAFNLEIYRS